jgi:arylformamidase
MAGIDYEAEYDNRARVPEHPAIMAGWQREAAAYRDEAAAEGRAEIGIRYGDTARQVIDLFSVAGGGAAPLALFVHGGYWRALEPALFSHLARGLNARGITVAIAGYDLCPQVTIADIIAEMQRACLHLWRRFGQRLLAIGHSAGGHLVACLLATDWKALDPALPPDLTPAAYAISGLFDLAPLLGVSMNADLRLAPTEARRISPIFWPAPRGAALDAVVGALESSEFLRQSHAITDLWGAGGVTTRYEEVAAANHFTVIGALADPHSAMVSRLMALSERVRGSER